MKQRGSRNGCKTKKKERKHCKVRPDFYLYDTTRFDTTLSQSCLCTRPTHPPYMRLPLPLAIVHHHPDPHHQHHYHHHHHHRTHNDAALKQGDMPLIDSTTVRTYTHRPSPSTRCPNADTDMPLPLTRRPAPAPRAAPPLHPCNPWTPSLAQPPSRKAARNRNASGMQAWFPVTAQKGAALGIILVSIHPPPSGWPLA
jgi:hypothetical protein